MLSLRKERQEYDLTIRKFQRIVMGGDSLFTAGIGENSAHIRARIAARLTWLGAVLDPKANAVHALRISASDSRVALYVIPTDEELMIARHTLAALSAESFQSGPTRKAIALAGR